MFEVLILQVNESSVLRRCCSTCYREYGKDSDKITMDRVCPLYLVPVSLIITCFCLINCEHVAGKIPAPLWWKGCL